MKPLLKKNAAELAAETLRGEIAAGRWTERLPGTRALAGMLDVSPPTVTGALQLLANEGWLEMPAARKAWRVAVGRQKSAAEKRPAGKSRCVILLHQDIATIVDSSRRLIEKLRDQMTTRGWEVDLQVVDFLHAIHPQKSWDERIRVPDGAPVIALYGRPALAVWAAKWKIRMLFLGGDSGGLPMPLLAVKSTGMVATAYDHLTSLGHWKIVFPLCDRTETYKKNLREVVRVWIESTGNPYVRAYHNPESAELSPGITLNIFESVFSRDVPTAMVLLDWKELVAAFCFLSRRGLRVPEDVSLVLLNDQMEAQWFTPSLCRFRYPERRLLKGLIQWLEHGTLAEPYPPANFIAGESVAPPRSV